jgi:ribosome modulation factor
LIDEMPLIDKTYFTLHEIQVRWDLPRRDLIYLAENGLLMLSARVYGVQLEHGLQEHDNDGRRFNIPEERVWFQGLQDLLPREFHALFQHGQLTVHWFATPEGRYCHLLEPSDGVLVLAEALVVRREERDRLERERGLGPTGRSKQPVFFQRQNFREVVLGDETFQLGPKQAQVVRLLYEAASREVPWCPGQELLDAVQSSCSRLSDLFKTKREWRCLIRSDGRGRYRLNVTLVGYPQDFS